MPLGVLSSLILQVIGGPGPGGPCVQEAVEVESNRGHERAWEGVLV